MLGLLKGSYRIGERVYVLSIHDSALYVGIINHFISRRAVVCISRGGIEVYRILPDKNLCTSRVLDGAFIELIKKYIKVNLHDDCNI